ncbi:MAG: hypothetical protein LBL56_03955, partial [Treponema sp.]|nr:hypothetical protein [Treponema sp.]
QLAGLEAREVNEAGEDVSPGVYRRSGGSLYTRIEDEKRDGGVITGSFRMGDGSRKTESNTYGAIDYRIENGVLTITDMNIADHRKDLTGEFFQDFAKKFADVDIQWNPATEADIALKEQLAANNRRGAGLNYFEPAAVRGESLETQQVKQGFDRQLAEALPRSTAESRMGAVSLLDRIGKGYGLDFDEFLDRLGFDRDNIFTNTPNKAVRDFNDRAAQYAKGPKGQAARGAMFKVLKKLDDDVKAVEYTVVYLDPKTADFSTVVHELKHAVDNFLEQADPDLYRRMMDAAGKYDPKSGLDETTWRKERSAYAWENYLQTGEAPTPELRSLFRQMVEWLRDIVKHLSGMRKLTPEQKAVFDELLTKADSFEQEAAQAGSKEDETRKDTSTAPGGSLRAASTLSGGFGEGGGESLSAAQGFTEEQHRGAMTPEQRRQWYADQKSRSFGTKTLQPISVTGNAETDLQAVYALLDTPEAWAEFNKIADDLQAEFGGKIHKRKSLKSWERAVRKIKGDEGASHITDINGMTLVVPTLERAYAIMDALSKRRETFVRGKDRYTNIDGQAVNYAHYRDFLLNVKLPSGGIVELQINTPQMLAAKEDMAGHTLYEITDQIHEEGKNISGDEQTEIDRLVDIADWKLYDAAFETVLEGASFNASSLDMRSELVAISDHFQEDGALARLLSEKTLQSVLLWPRNANGLSSQEINTSEESSNEGTTSNGLTSGRESNVSLENLGSVVVNSVPSTSNIDQARENVNRDVDRNVDSSGVPAIREQYRAAKKTEGYEDTKNVGGEEIEGRWVLVEAETPTASHDETTFSETQGFPSSNGKTINDRDYRNDRAAQEAVIKMAAGYDSRALEGVVITDDGVVISGNNRTMSGKRAAREGTDGKYISALEKKAKKYGFTAEQVREYQHPRLVFEVAANGDYSTGLFAQFNQSTRKAQSPMETAVKMSKRLAESPGVIQSIAVVINEHDTLSELYGDKKAVRDIFNTLEKDKLIGEYDRPQYVDEGGQITGAGEDLLESVMLGSVLDEGNIRGLQGARSIRQKLVRGITALVENKGMGAYSFIPEMNEAVGIALAVNNTTGKDGKQVYGTVQDYVKQQILPGMPQGLTVEKRASIQLAEALDSGGQKEFALWFGGLNASMSAAAKGQSELFTGGVESKESILDRYTGYREDLAERKKANQETLTDPAAGQAAKARAALDDAGIAKAEADGSLFQTTIDDEYFKAIETGDMETAQRLVDAQARKNGYISTDEYRMAHQAPSKGDYNLLTIKESGVVPDDYWTHPKYYQYEASEFESFYSITKALDLAKRINREPGMFMYRAVPKDVKEDSFRNGDWITPSKNNASLEGESIPGGYRLVSQRVLLKNIWWDGNSINEFGFDDGENYTYKNTKNNRKLNDVIVRDYDGKIVPPSKRFNYRAHEIFFQTYEELLEDAARYESAEAFEAAYKGQDRTEDNRRQTAEWLLNSEPITTVKDDEIKITGKGKTFIDNIDGYFKEHWGSTVNRGDQVILLTREGIRSSLHHGYGKAKINAFAAVPHIIQNGKVIDTQNNWKNRGYDSYTVAAPFKIGDVEYIGEVIVNQHKDGKNTFYLHEVTEKSKLRGASQAGYETSTPEGASIKIIVQFFEKVKQEAADFHAPSDADRAWFEAFWKDARTAAKGTTLFSTEEAAPGAPEQGDRAFLKDINRKNLADVLITLHNDLFAGQTEPVAPEPGEDRGAYDKEMAKYRKAGELKARINRELPNRMAWVGIAAKVANGEELSTADYNTLRGYLRESPRDYRALFADLMDRPEWGLNLT